MTVGNCGRFVSVLNLAFWKYCIFYDSVWRFSQLILWQMAWWWWHVLSISVQAAVLSGGGSCDGGFWAPSVCLASGQTAVVPLVQLQPGPHTPWTGGPGSVLAFSQHSWLPAGTPGLQNRDTEREIHRQDLLLCVYLTCCTEKDLDNSQTLWNQQSDLFRGILLLCCRRAPDKFIVIIYSWTEHVNFLIWFADWIVYDQTSTSWERLLVWPEQSRAVAVSSEYSASVTRNVFMLWKKLSTGPERSSLLPVHEEKMDWHAFFFYLKRFEYFFQFVTLQIFVCLDSPELISILVWIFSLDSTFLSQLCVDIPKSCRADNREKEMFLFFWLNNQPKWKYES